MASSAPPFATAASDLPAALQPWHWLHLPLHQRVVTQLAATDDGRPEWRLFYGREEIAFDEPELFEFARSLGQQACFRAGDAVHWGQPGGWDRVCGLLQQLVDSGILRRIDGPQAVPQERVLGDAAQRPSPLPPAPSARPRSWHECPGLMQELTGQPLDIGHLELVVPIFRVAHMAVDAEGRQVGEANAFPAALRIDVATRWRTCIYAGSRFQDDKPMNVSALKSMRAHWPAMMAMLLQMRQAYLRRCPDAAAGWTVGHVERFATAVLALPAWQLMRREGRVGHGELDPVLSSMFRVTDGLRMTMHDMLFVPFGEPTRKPATPITAAEVHAYAERAFSLHSEHGVCAGPRAMIDEFLAVVIDGQAPRAGLPAVLPAALQQALADIEPAIDYALRGLQAYAAVFSLWPISMRCWEALHTLSQAWAAAEPAGAAPALRDWLAPIAERLRSETHLATEAWRADREHVYDDMHAACARALGDVPPPPLAQLLAPRALPATHPAMQALQAATLRHFGTATSAAGVRLRQQWLATLGHYCVQAQAVVRCALQAQARINALLGRAAPATRFTAADVDLYVQLEGHRSVPFLLHELQRVLGLAIVIDAQDIRITSIPATAAPAVARPEPGPPGTGAPEFARHGASEPACSLHVI